MTSHKKKRESNAYNPKGGRGEKVEGRTDNQQGTPPTFRVRN